MRFFPILYISLASVFIYCKYKYSLARL